MNRFPAHRRHAAGFSLVEIAIALAVVSFCLTVLMALLPTGITDDNESLSLTSASGIAQEVAADLRNTLNFSQDDGAATATSPLFSLVIPGSGQQANSEPQTLFFGRDGSFSATSVSTSAFRVCVTCSPPPAGERAATMVRILVTWPALADPASSTWPAHALGSFETLIALDRN